MYVPDLDCFTREFTQSSETDQILTLHIFFQSMETKKEFWLLLSKNIIWISNSDSFHKNVHNKITCEYQGK